MAGDELDETVRRFLDAYVDGYDQLDALLLVAHRSDTPWTTASVAERLGLPAAAAQIALDHLVRARLVVESRSGGTRTLALDPAHADVVARLERAYAADRLAIVRWMNARAIARVRTEALRTFSDAFLFRKKKDDG